MLDAVDALGVAARHIFERFGLPPDQQAGCFALLAGNAVADAGLLPDRRLMLLSATIQALAAAAGAESEATYEFEGRDYDA